MSNIEATVSLSKNYLLAEAEASGELFTLNPRDQLYHQGEPGDSLYIVKSGLIYTSYKRDPTIETTARPSGADRTIIDGVFKEGSIVGFEVFDAADYESSAFAATKTDVITIDREKFLLLVAYNPALAFAIGEVVSEQVNRTEEHNLFVNKGTAKQRVHRATNDFTYNNKVQVNQYQLSQRAGMVREEFNRTLNGKKQTHRRI